MSRQQSRKTESRAKKLGAKKASGGKKTTSARQRADDRDDRNKRRFVTRYPGVAAQDLPGGGRDSVETDVNKERKRTTPDFSGGSYTKRGGYSDAGMRGALNATDGDAHGGRKRN